LKIGSFFVKTLYIKLYNFLGISHSVLLNRTQKKVSDKQAPVSQCKTVIAVYISDAEVYPSICTLYPQNKCGYTLRCGYVCKS